MNRIPIMSDEELVKFLNSLFPKNFGEEIYQKQLAEIMDRGLKIGDNPPTVSIPIEFIPRILRLLDVKLGKVFYDLGCGFGQVLIGAAMTGASAIGYDIREEVVEVAKEKIKEAGLEKRAEVYHGDIKTKIEGIEYADSVYLYLTDKILSDIGLELIKNLKNGCLVGSMHYEIYTLCAYLKEKYKFDGTSFYLYQIRK